MSNLAPKTKKAVGRYSSGGGSGGRTSTGGGLCNGPVQGCCFIANSVTSLVCERIGESKLKRLAEHKYSTSGSTLLDPIMQKFWNWFLGACIPLWWAPNAMTLVGLVINVFTCSLLVYYSPDAKQSIPAYALVLAAIGLFLYQTLDACDGKQARRTKTSSVLGELFDHGCDSVSTLFVSLSVCLSVQLGEYTTWMVVLCAGATSLFYTAHWQAYVSGTLKFGKFDVTEAQFTIIIIHLISAVFGTEIWNTQVFGIPFKLIPMAGTILNEIRILFCDIKAILGGGAGKNGSTVADTSILSPVIPILLVYCFTVLIYTKSTSAVFVDHLCLYIITFGLVAAKITNKLVVAHMSKSEITKMDTVFIGPALLFFNQYFNFYFDEYHVLWAAFAYILLDFCYYCYSTCRQLADYFGIYVLIITSRPEPRQTSAGSIVSSSSEAAAAGSASGDFQNDSDDEESMVRETDSLLPRSSHSPTFSNKPTTSATKPSNFTSVLIDQSDQDCLIEDQHDDELNTTDSFDRGYERI